MFKDQKEAERKLKEKFTSIFDQKQSEIARINRELQISQAQLKQQKSQSLKLVDVHKQLQA